MEVEKEEERKERWNRISLGVQSTFTSHTTMISRRSLPVGQR